VSGHLVSGATPLTAEQFILVKKANPSYATIVSLLFEKTESENEPEDERHPLFEIIDFSLQHAAVLNHYQHRLHVHNVSRHVSNIELTALLCIYRI
jgi:hypothetical protein